MKCQCSPQFVKPDIVAIIFVQFIQDTLILRIRSFFLLCLSGTLETREVCQKNLLNFIRSCANIIFNINNPYGIKLLTRLWLGLSYLRDHKFRHCFQDTQNPLCDCGNDTETITHFFLHCPSFRTSRQILLNNIRNINKRILPHGEDHLVKTFLYRNPSCNLTINRLI